MAETLDQASITRLAIENVLRSLRTCEPGRITKVRAKTVDVQPIMRIAIPRGEDLPPLVETCPVIQSCPVFILGGGNVSIRHPIAVGDDVLIVFSGRDPATWFNSGNSPIAPGDNRTHGLSGAIVLAGLKHLAAMPAFPSHLEFHNGSMQVTITSTTMDVGGTSKHAAIAEDCSTNFTAIKGALDTIAAAVPVSHTYIPSSVASAKLRMGG